MVDAGTIALDDREVDSLRDYLLKGGFLFVSDTWGALAREQFDEEIGRVLPGAEYPMAGLPMGAPALAVTLPHDGAAADAVDPVVATIGGQHQSRRDRGARSTGHR